MKTTLNYLGPVLVALLLAGCAGDSDVERFIKDPGVTGAKPSPLPEVKPFPVAKYNRDEIKDPFTAPLSIKFLGKNHPGSPDMARARQHLEGYPLDALQMTGYMSQDGKPYALVQDSEKQIHRVVVGNYMGQDFGKVVSITREGLTVIEAIQDNTGGWAERMIILPFVAQDEKSAFSSGSKTASAQ